MSIVTIVTWQLLLIYSNSKTRLTFTTTICCNKLQLITNNISLQGTLVAYLIVPDVLLRVLPQLRPIDKPYVFIILPGHIEFNNERKNGTVRSKLPTPVI